MKKRVVHSVYVILAAVSLWPALNAGAFPRDIVLQGIKGPWELYVQFGTQDTGLTFPVEVADEDAAQTLNRTLPIVGTPLQVELLQYCPDLEWTSTIIEDPDGGPVATLKIAGKGTEQEVVLLADYPEKHSVTASIGGLAIRQIKDGGKVEALLDEIIEKKAVGLLTFWADPNQPQTFVADRKGSFELPNTPYKVEILEYAPHYSIDRQTKKVTSYSDNPVNPALKIRMSNGQNSYEQWLWSNFSASPHSMSKLPVKVRFCDFDLGPSAERFFLVTARDSKDVMLYSKKDDKIRYEPMQFNKPYPFKGQDYTFTLNSMLDKGVPSRTWANKADKLEHPALVVSVESNGVSQETVLELNSPGHVKTEYGTVVLVYRQQTQKKQHGEK